MKFRLFFSIAIFLYSYGANADTTTIVPDKAKSHPDITKSQIGIHLDQSQNVFFEQFSSYNYALQVLQSKNTFNNYDLIIGGSLQTDWQHWYGDRLTTTPVSVYNNGNAGYLTQATIDIMGNVNHWTTAFLSIADGHIGRPTPDGNDIFLNRAMFIFGNLDKFPVYAMVGTNTIPFGIFNGSGVWDTPLTGSYFNPSQAPQVSVAYYKNGLNVIITAFSDQADHQNHNVFSVYYNKKINKFNYSLGAGYLTNLQSNATGSITTHRKRKRDLPPGLHLGNITDLNASIAYGQLSLSGEYNQGSEKLLNNTAVPRAVSVTLTYVHGIAGRDATFGISRSRSYNLAAVPTSLEGEDNLPLSADGLKNTWAISASRNFFSKNISLGVDLEKNETYLAATTYTGTVELFLYL
jgi:hypothetical protein